MNLTRLLTLNAIFTFAAGVVLIVAPGLIPSAVGLELDPGEYLMSYLLAGTELSLAALCFYGRTLTDAAALRVIALACFVFHASSGVLEIYAFTQGVSAAVWANVAVRALFAILFVYYGFSKSTTESTAA